MQTLMITGCSTGIGHACALGMHDRGWRVFATARTPADQQALTRAGVEALYLDYRDADSIQDAFTRVMEATQGRLDALFNNGAYAQPGAVEDLSQAAIREQFDANFFGWHELVRLAIPPMRERGQGRIVQNSSVLGLVALRYRGAYTASKFALEGYTDTLRLELMGTGIHVCSIQPGPIRTQIGRNALLAAHKHIDWMASVHREAYARRYAALESGQKSGQKAAGQLPPEAVLKPLIHACEHPRPRPYYRVTVPTRAMALARRLLPAWALIRILDRVTR